MDLVLLHRATLTNGSGIYSLTQQPLPLNLVHRLAWRDVAVHNHTAPTGLAWGDVAVDNHTAPTGLAWGDVAVITTQPQQD